MNCAGAPGCQTLLACCTFLKMVMTDGHIAVIFRRHGIGLSLSQSQLTGAGVVRKRLVSLIITSLLVICSDYLKRIGYFTTIIWVVYIMLQEIFIIYTFFK